MFDLGQLMQLDGTYCCASCGKVTEILGCWKKQFIMAKEARRVMFSAIGHHCVIGFWMGHPDLKSYIKL